MAYLDGFMKEVLLLYPSVWIVVCNTVEETTLNGTKIPATCKNTIYDPHPPSPSPPSLVEKSKIFQTRAKANGRALQ